MLAGMRLTVAAIAVAAMIIPTCPALSADDPAYTALSEIARINSKTINSAGCLVSGSVDFEGFQSKLSVFRERWLNRDYSEDFYRQRRKQVFV